MTGTLFGVGVGPGDPELMTLKAARVVASSPVVAAIGADGRPSRALRIAAAHVPGDAIVLQHAMPMRSERAAGEAVYAALADAIGPHLQAGRDVAFLCEGDPLFYGSFLGLLERAGADWRIEVVPGVSSVMAAAARALHPLARREEPLTVLPATAPRDVLAAAARSSASLVILKVGRHLDTVRTVLAEAGRLESALIAVEVGGPSETIRPLRETGDAPYFSLVLSGGAPG